jgi:hypothetical protein
MHDVKDFYLNRDRASGIKSLMKLIVTKLKI